MGPYDDYQAVWNVIGTGAIVIDDIQIANVGTGQVVASENAERQAPSTGPGLQLLNGAYAVTEPTLVIAGRGSLRVGKNAMVATNPAVLPTRKHDLHRRTAIPHSRSGHRQPSSGGMAATNRHGGGIAARPRIESYNNAPLSGMFSSGARTNSAAAYVLNIASFAQSDVIIDDITILQQSRSLAASPPAWSRLETLPYPRLGKYELADTVSQAVSGGLAEGPPFRITLDEVESPGSLSPM